MTDEQSPEPRILVVDDEPANVRLLERMLTGAGWSAVRTTTDSRQAVALREDFKPDVVLLDLMMPHMDGIAVLKALRTAPDREDYLPVIVLTADSTPEAKIRALDAGATDFLTKPLDRVEVVLRIRNLLETRRLYRALERQNRSLEDTVRERMQQLLQSEKVATMGSLLAGVAHELNNPLAVIMGQCHLLGEIDDPSVAARAAKLNAAATRCARIVRNFLGLARQHPPERVDVMLNQVVQDALELLAYELRSDSVEVDLALADDLPRLSADGHQLHQVVVNLVANAHQAMRRLPGPRRIRISSRHDVARAAVELAIADSGPGIPPELQHKVFEAFFTTKPPGQGTGLGLSLCRRIVEEHGGSLDLASAPGQGATFRIVLPMRAAGTTPARVTEDDPAPVPGQTILIVDDERDIAEMLAEIFRRDGHTAHTAVDGAAALEMLRQGAYDLVVTDTKMPGIDGVAFYREIERGFPSLRDRVVFVTGDVLDPDKQAFLEATGAPVLVKPFDIREVRAVVCRRLGALEPPARGRT